MAVLLDDNAIAKMADDRAVVIFSAWLGAAIPAAPPPDEATAYSLMYPLTLTGDPAGAAMGLPTFVWEQDLEDSQRQIVRQAMVIRRGQALIAFAAAHPGPVVVPGGPAPGQDPGGGGAPPAPGVVQRPGWQSVLLGLGIFAGVATLGVIVYDMTKER